MYLTIILLLSLASATYADEICYDELGCYSDNWPFTSAQRPIGYLPWSPTQINTEFWLYTRRNPILSQTISYQDGDSITSSNFRALRPTKFLVHGFSSDGTGWTQTLKDAILDAEDVNVIVVDWEEGANPGYNYGQASANTRVVGSQIAVLINKLWEFTGALEVDMHVIGHSLGAHIAGYAGDRLTRMGRITGLDPAEPFFQGTEPIVRLDPTDALYVDVIHTDGQSFWKLGWGMSDPVGHADFYPNGGFDQPGCPGNEDESGDWWKVGCSHGRACDLMIDSIINAEQSMIGNPCSSYEEYLNGNCNGCSEVGCAKMGYYSNQDASNTVAVKYYLKTGSESPFRLEK